MNSDESHALKTPNSKRTAFVSELLKSQPETRAVLITGTPVQSRPIEIWPQVSMFACAKVQCLGRPGMYLNVFYCRCLHAFTWFACKCSTFNQTAGLRVSAYLRLLCLVAI